MVFLFSLVLLVILDTALRTLYLTPFMGTMELVRCFLIWSVFIALRYTTSEDAHIRMGEVMDLFPRPFQQAVKILGRFAAVAVFGLITASTVVTTINNARDTTPTLEIPLVIFFLPTVVGFLLVTIQYSINLFDALRGR
ncbi:MAG: TRAP transporter small permease [Syntrophaceae bacterium]|nr:TRAP transporter small permease [Syntrophaceae bacterium]